MVENNQCFDGQQANCTNTDVCGSHLKSISGSSAQSLITTSLCLNAKITLPDIKMRLFLELEHHRHLVPAASNSLLGLGLHVLFRFFSKGKVKDLMERIGQFRQNETLLSNCRL